MRGRWIFGIALMQAALTMAGAAAEMAKPPIPVAAPAGGTSASKTPNSAAAGAETESEEPKLDAWGESEIEEAKRLCAAALKEVSAKVEPLPPIKNGPCGDPAPVKLISMGQDDPVQFKPAATVSCRMLAPLQLWIRRGLQPMAARHLDGSVKTVSVMSSYSCRRRYGRKNGKMSEHAYANALDIGGFRLADGRRVSVLKHWGPTKRDIEKAVEVADAKISPEQKAPPGAQSKPSTKMLEAVTIDKRSNSQRRIRERRADRSREVARTEPRKRQSDRSGIERNAAAAETPPLPPLPRSLEETITSAPRKTGGRQAARRDVQRTERRLRRLPPAERPVERRPRGERQRWFARIEPRSRSAFAKEADEVRLPPLPERRPLRRAVPSKLSYDRVPFVRPEQSDPKETKPFPAAPYRLGGPKLENEGYSLFLKGVHRAGCRIFGTTLGPEANEAHRNHFHFDMFPRRRGGYCE